jgi:hypothetical protein
MRALFAFPLLMMLALPAWADARLTVLVDVLKLREAAHILREEGLVYAGDLDAEMLNGQGGAGWQVQVEAIYSADRMVDSVRTALDAELEGDALETAITFFASDLGQKIVTLENSARQAMGEADVEEAARARYAELADGDDARLAQLKTFVASGDMLNRNVTAALNSNYQFMRGLADGDVVEMSDEEILNDVAGDMEEITEDTTAWLYGFFLLAYHPLSDAELDRYIAFSKTKSGEALNRALFDGFGVAYDDISYALGRAVALNMTAQEL